MRAKGPKVLSTSTMLLCCTSEDARNRSKTNTTTRLSKNWIAQGRPTSNSTGNSSQSCPGSKSTGWQPSSKAGSTVIVKPLKSSTRLLSKLLKKTSQLSANAKYCWHMEKSTSLNQTPGTRPWRNWSLDWQFAKMELLLGPLLHVRSSRAISSSKLVPSISMKC